MSRALRRGTVISLLCGVLLVGEAEPIMRLVWAEPAEIREQADEVLETYLAVEEALALAFPSAERFEVETVRLTAEQATRVAELAGHPLLEDALIVHTALRDGRVQGYGVVTEEIGRFHFITFLVAATPAGEVQRVEVLVYRESRGGEVRHRRFLHQYEGKSLREPIRLNRDIINITGATLSVRAINRGVRKVLGMLRETVLSGS